MEQKISRFEAILITAIVIMCAFFIVLALQWPVHSTEHRDDAMWANTALSAATINSNNGQGCIIDARYNACDSVNNTIGYFDPSSNTIVAEKPSGYNQETRIRLNGVTYRGDKNTLVIEVRSENGEVKERWTEGKQ